MLKGLKLTKRAVNEQGESSEIPKTDHLSAGPPAPKFKTKYDFAELEQPSHEALATTIDLKSREDLVQKAEDIWELLSNGKIIQAQSHVNSLDNWTQRLLMGQSSLTLGATNNGPQLSLAPTFNSKADAFEHNLGMSEGLGKQGATAAQKVDRKAGYLERIKNRAEKKESLVLANCRLCLANAQLREEEVLSVGNHFYVLQPRQTPFPGKHLLLVPLAHCRSVREVPEHAREELELFLAALSGWARSQHNELLCLETAYLLDNIPHAKLEVVLAPTGTFDEAALFFTQCFEGVDGDWNTHRKVIALSADKGGLFRQIPPGFPYVAVLWGPHEGLLHIIEEEDKFDRKVVYQVVATMMESDSLLSKAAKEITSEQMLQLKAVFTTQFKPFEPVL